MNNNQENKKYESLKIPCRQQGSKGRPIQSPIETDAKPIASLPDNMFCEMEYDSNPIPDVGKFVPDPQPQKIQQSKEDEAGEIFGRMRDIARAHRSTYDFPRFFDRRVQNDNAIIFHKQGLFMKDFTDDYGGNAGFSQYFPYYQMMGYEQLRTYFTWRTQVRLGTVADTSLSYAFLYIYELLGNIGVTDPQDGLDKLIFFWKAFSKHNGSIDKYVLRWLKDYHIYYELPHSFKEFVEKNGLAEHYPKLAEPGDSFDLFCAITKYNIKKSAFYTDETSKMIADCFAFVMDRIRREFELAGMDFDGVLFRPTRKLVIWRPFKGALFYHWLKQRDRHIILSENEIYLCRNNEWTASTMITTQKGRQFVGYVMKQMESVLRKLTKYKFKLTAHIGMINDDTIRVLTKAGLSMEKIVTAGVVAYHREATQTIVTVDHTSLARIRQEALVTQQSLIVEEEANRTGTVPTPVLFAPQDQNMFADAAEEVAPAPHIRGTPRDVFNENELQALAVILQQDDIKAFADGCGIMMEVLVDGINEKAMDYIGDSLIDEEFVLYDDYKEQVKEWIK